MKNMKRRLLSLLMAAVMVCTLVPVGWADENEPALDAVIAAWGKTCKSTDSEDGNHKPLIGNRVVESDCKSGLQWTYTCQNEECTESYTYTAPTKDHVFGTDSYKPNHDNTHTAKCTVCEKDVTIDCVAAGSDYTCRDCKEEIYRVTLSKDSVTIGHNGSVSLTATVYKGTSALSSSYSVEWKSSDTSVAKVEDGYVTAVASKGSATITATYKMSDSKSVSADCKVTVNNPLTITPNYSKKTFNSIDDSITLTASLNGETSTIKSVDWRFYNVGSSGEHAYFSLSSYSDNPVRVTPKSTALKTSTCTIIARVTDIYGNVYENSIDLSMDINDEISLSASVSDEYYFDDVSNVGSYSVERQLENELSRLYVNYGTSSVYLEYVTFQTVSNDYGKLDVSTNTRIYPEEFGDIKFTPIKTGTSTFRFTAYVYSYYEGKIISHSGILTITVTGTTDSKGDVVFYGDMGEDVYLDSAEFEDFWDSQFSGGELSYVTFGSVSGGSLLDVDGKSVGSRKFYVSATRSQYEINDVYFRPSNANASKAVTISISFTAYGVNKSGTSKDTSGTLNIVYMSKSPSDIKYTVGSNNTVNLKASDFTAAYKEATGSSAPSNMTVVFQGVPSNGSLTYKDSSKNSSSTVNLTSSNIRSRNFTMSSTGTNQVGDVTYTNNGTTSDTIEYVAYSGNTAKFKGKVVLSGKSVPTDITVTYQSANGQQVQLSWADFTNKNSALTGASKVRFGAPSYGTLYLNGGAISSSTEILVTQVYSVIYVPRTGTNGQERITFTAMDANSQTVGSGTVSITITGNAATPSNPNGITSASQFTDVTTGAWYYTYLDDLVRKGIVSGRDDGSFDPNGTVTYGEALKLVLEAAGHSAAATTGNEWAINYKNLAVQNGWITNDIVLTAPIQRLATAELIARVLGLSPYTGTSPFADTSNGYAGALYYTNPQIFIGNANPSGGRPLFNNSTRTTLTRAEICTIIYRMNAYYNSHNQSTPSTPSTSETTVEVNPSTGLPDGL